MSFVMAIIILTNVASAFIQFPWQTTIIQNSIIILISDLIKNEASNTHITETDAGRRDIKEWIQIYFKQFEWKIIYTKSFY